ncbi:TetR/AcrR family transcriptional regulator [uncultured Litoreibacter sp.]|uniref:TetR/AcrR family transcriptional regulator n=1 Tax=uncultured Litoreibacter sp. TaxID=1392394 RepID=UPI002614137B|nr:TetR/AcrR family transcriptional regulator [uncultured Litoreibacter sp.]
MSLDGNSSKVSARSSNRLGRASRDQIIEAAEKLLLEDGYHELSTRKVAAACGISPGNLTYHFPSKILLVEEVMHDVCERYAKVRPEVPVFGSDADPISELRRILAWMIDDAMVPETNGLFLEFWILAKHHGFGTQIIERSYELAIAWLVDVTAALFPTSTDERRHQAAYLMLTVTEGTIPVFARKHARPSRPADLVDPTVQAVVSILTDELQRAT